MDKFSDEKLSIAVADLLKTLDLEQLEVNLFRGHSPQTGWQRVYGGLVISQALVAAMRTVEGRNPHSMHAYFLLGGDPKVPIIYDVERIRDGGSFTTRQVKAIQHGRPIFSMSVSFHNDEEMLSHQAKMPDVPQPESLISEQQVRERFGESMPEPVKAYYDRQRPIEMRPVDFGRYFGKKDPEGRFNVWIKAVAPLPDDPAIHQCVLAYASDMTLLDTALVPHGRTLFEPQFQGASLDHALWLHRPFRADEWLLYSQDAPNLNGSRGLSRGLIFRRDGTLVASVMQEGLVRLKRGESL
jgi:acyl-CoA thioesterase II